MSDFSLFFIGALISLIWAAAALGPFLYVASQAELDWRERKILVTQRQQPPGHKGTKS